MLRHQLLQFYTCRANVSKAKAKRTGNRTGPGGACHRFFSSRGFCFRTGWPLVAISGRSFALVLGCFCLRARPTVFSGTALLRYFMAGPYR